MNNRVTGNNTMGRGAFLAVCLTLAAAVLSRQHQAEASAASFFTTQAKKCLTERLENLSPTTQRLCLALDTLVQLADVMDEKTMEEALRRAGMDEEFLAERKFSDKHGTLIDPSVKRDDKYEHMFMRFGRKRRSPNA